VPCSGRRVKAGSSVVGSSSGCPEMVLRFRKGCGTANTGHHKPDARTLTNTLPLPDQTYGILYGEHLFMWVASLMSELEVDPPFEDVSSLVQWPCPSATLLCMKVQFILLKLYLL
jgi:hypothetical protein